MIEGLRKGMKPTGRKKAKSLHGKFPISFADFADSA